MTAEVTSFSVPRGLKGHRIAIVLSLAVIALILIALIQSNPAEAAKSVTWERFDVTLDLRKNGTYHVNQRQQILFAGGTFSGGFATLPLDRIDAITNIELGEEVVQGAVTSYQFVPWDEFNETPLTYSYHETGSEIEINWGFPEAENEVRTFILDYDVAGALRIYGTEPDISQQIWWTAVSKDVTDVAPVEQATMTIHLPNAIDPATAILGVDADEKAADHTTDGKTWTWTQNNLGSGDEFIVRLEFPKLVDAPVPNWQQADDAQRLEEEKQNDRQSLYDLTFLGIGALLAILGGIGPSALGTTAAAIHMSVWSRTSSRLRPTISRRAR